MDRYRFNKKEVETTRANFIRDVDFDILSSMVRLSGELDSCFEEYNALASEYGVLPKQEYDSSITKINKAIVYNDNVYDFFNRDFGNKVYGDGIPFSRSSIYERAVDTLEKSFEPLGEINIENYVVKNSSGVNVNLKQLEDNTSYLGTEEQLASYLEANSSLDVDVDELKEQFYDSRFNGSFDVIDESDKGISDIFDCIPLVGGIKQMIEVAKGETFYGKKLEGFEAFTHFMGGAISFGLDIFTLGIGSAGFTLAKGAMRLGAESAINLSINGVASAVVPIFPSGVQNLLASLGTIFLLTNGIKLKGASVKYLKGNDNPFNVDLRPSDKLKFKKDTKNSKKVESKGKKTRKITNTNFDIVYNKKSLPKIRKLLNKTRKKQIKDNDVERFLRRENVAKCWVNFEELRKGTLKQSGKSLTPASSEYVNEKQRAIEILIREDSTLNRETAGSIVDICFEEMLK